MDQSYEPPSSKTGARSGVAGSAGDRSAPDPDALPKGGTIELRSGRWKWTAHVVPEGLAFVFHEEKAPANRMRAWLPGSKAAEEDVLRAAREPELRWWEDPVGTVWEARLEETHFPRSLEQRSRPRMRITFYDGGKRIGTELPDGRTLGELTAAELTALLYEST